MHLPLGLSMLSSHKEAEHLLKVLLATLRSAHLIHWTGHWQVMGDTQYGDHLLLDRVYSSFPDDIDTLAEKIVSTYGPDSVDPVEQSKMMAECTSVLTPPCEPVLERSLQIEEQLQKLLKATYDKLKECDNLTLGMDDFIMALSNTHDTFIYLLRQRLR